MLLPFLLLLLLVFPASAQAVYGGSPVGDTQPWLVQIKLPRGVCTGSLIAPDRVLTAAHCATEHPGFPLRSVRVGYGSDYLYSLKWQTVRRRQIHVPRSYRWKRGGVYNDLAVLKLSKPVKLETLTLGGLAAPRREAAAVQSGWGVTQEWSYPSYAQRTDSPLWSGAKCRDALRRADMDWQRSEAWLCAGDLAEGNPDLAHTACWGDSGSPLVVEGRGVGVLSWFAPSRARGLQACVSGPMYYTRLTDRLRRWIALIT